MLDRDEIDGRRKRCDDAVLRADRHDVGFPPTPGLEGAVSKLARSLKLQEAYKPEGKRLKQFRDKKHALKDATEAGGYDQALIALVLFTKVHGDEIIADIRAGMTHEQLA
jgi:hypothetical protein